MNKVGKVLLVAIITGMMLLLAGCNPIEAPKSNLGVIKLSRYHMDDSRVVALNGEWDFYWNELLTYEEIKNKKPDLRVTVPDSWDNYILGHKNLPGQGIATYRMRVHSNFSEGTLLAFKIRTISSAYHLYVNDKLIAEAGIVGENAEEEKGAYHPTTAVFEVPGEEFDIILQVSNFHYARGGIWDRIYLGSVDEIHHFDNRLTGRETFLIGILLIIALFHFALFLLLKELRFTLYFSLIALSGAIAVDTAGQMLFINSSLPFRFVIYIWYSATGWMALFLMLFMHELFPSGISRWIVRIYSILMIIQQMIFIFTDPVYYTKYAMISNISEILAIGLSVLILIFAKKQDQKYRISNLISILIILVALVHDILYMTNQLQSSGGELFYFGVVVSLSLQMIVLAQRIKSYFNHKVSSELMLLQAQIKPHFLYNTINTIISISRTDAERARNLLIDFSLYLRRRFDLKESNQLVALSDELELVKAYIAIEKARFGQRLTVDFDIQEGLENEKVPILVLQPIIENAIIHGVLPKPEGGRVEIRIKQEGRWISFLVEDNGVGIEHNEPETLLEQKERGIGLSNIHMRLLRLYKRGLEVSSEATKGTQVRWYILANRSGR